MAKKKVNFIDHIKHWLISHPWLKLIALILTIIVWLYVKEEINRFN